MFIPRISASVTGSVMQKCVARNRKKRDIEMHAMQWKKTIYNQYPFKHPIGICVHERKPKGMQVVFINK
jgi:hypothetical protein